MNKNKTKNLTKFIKFFITSGTGWIIDFSVFWSITHFWDFTVVYANMLSSIPAITLVFLVSTHKIFANKTEGLPLWGKYLVYFIYQLVLVVCVSSLGQWIYQLISGTSLMAIKILSDHLKIVCKILITPITMTINFFVMKMLCEKL